MPLETDRGPIDTPDPVVPRPDYLVLGWAHYRCSQQEVTAT
jgi:hypothetical protein